jgi:polygalacturonase
MKTTSSSLEGHVQHVLPVTATNHFYRRFSPAVQVVLLLAALGLGSAQAATYSVKTQYGKVAPATGNGSTNDTAGVNNAIFTANAAGGGIVEFPSGKYLCGSIQLLSNVTLQLDSGSTILGSKGKNGVGGINDKESENSAWSSYQDYGHDYFHDALIWADGASNIGITGPGTIDGNGALQTSQPSSGSGIGTKGLCLKECNNVMLSSFTLKNGGWFGFLIQGTNNIVMTNVSIKDSNQRDAFDLINAQHVDISDSDIEGSDDSMCLKSDYALGPVDSHGNLWDNWDIHVDNCTILSTGNNAVQFGSETVFNFHDCTFSNLTITAAGKAGLGVTSNDGAIIDGITFSNITMTGCVTPIWVKLTDNHRKPSNFNLTPPLVTPPVMGKISNISFINITSSDQPSGNIYTSSVFGCGTISPAVTIDNIVFNNVKQTVPGGGTASQVTTAPPETNEWQPRYLGTSPAYGFFLRHVNGISFINCQTRFSKDDDRAVVVCDNDGQNIKVDGLNAQVGTAAPYDLSFLNTTGYQSTNNVNTSGAALRVHTSGSTAASIVSPAVFTPSSGTYLSGQTVTLASSTSGATIRYTLTDNNATAPIAPTSSTGTLYSGPITLTADTTLMAIASASGLTDSAVNTSIYTIASSDGGQVAAPAFSPAGGTYTSAQTVSITSATSGASIRYTTDGSTPTETAGTVYSGSVSISATTTLKAIAYASGFTDSSVASATYTIGSAPATLNFEAESITYAATGATASVQTDTNSSGGKWVELAATGATSQYIDYTVTKVPAGTYQVQMEWKGNTSRGILQLSVDGTNLGSTLDQYSATQVYPTTPFGTVTFTSTGNHDIRLTVTGKNTASSNYYLSADKFTLVGQ